MKKESFILVFKLLIVLSIFPSIAVIVMRLINPYFSVEVYYCFQIIIMYLALFLLAMHWKRKYEINFNIKNYNGHINKSDLLIVILAGIGFSCFFSFSYHITYFETRIPNGFTEETFAQLYNSFPMLLSTSIIMPVIEEIVFRGVLQNLLIGYLDAKWGILISVFIFSLLHGKGFIFGFLFSLFIAYIYYKTQNIVFPIMAHISNNLTNVILMKLELIGPDKNMILIICFGFILLCFAIIRFIKVRNNE